MAVAAEQQAGWMLAERDLPELDALAERQLKQFIGGIAIRGTLAAQESREGVNQTTLLSAIQLASLGDESARRVVWTNVATDVGERLYKAGHQTAVWLHAKNGKLQQEGRALTDIHANTLRYTVLIPEMLRRTRHDIKNVLLIEQLHAHGLLEEHDAVIFSPASTGMSLQDKKDYHFFTDTETCSIQKFSANKDDILLETAFVAGKKTPASERHDLAAIRALAERSGATLATDDGSEMLRHILLVPKRELPNGIADVVALYDEAAGGTFYGEAKPRQDYAAYARQCEERNRHFETTVQNITTQLLREAHAFESPLEAIERLDELSERYCVKYAVRHDHINAAIFGTRAAMHIEEARFFAEQGDEKRAANSLIKAQQTADSGSCPLFKGGGSSESGNDSSKSDSNESSGKKWMKCPFCSARVFDDPCAKVLSCGDCKARVVNGAVRSKGNGGTKARQEKRQAEETRRLAELAEQVDEAYREQGVDEKDFEATAQNKRPAQQHKTMQPAGV